MGVFILTLLIILVFIMLITLVAENGFSVTVEDILKALNMISEYRKSKHKRKKEN